MSRFFTCPSSCAATHTDSGRGEPIPDGGRRRDLDHGVDDLVKFEADEDEEGAAEQVGADLPKTLRLLTGTSVADRAVAGLSQPAADDRHHAGHAQLLCR